MNEQNQPHHVALLGATGAVGTEVLRTLIAMPTVARITVLTRRPLSAVDDAKIVEHIVDPLDPKTYANLVAGHDTAICTLGVGAASSVSKEEFLRVDRDAVIAFGQTCKTHGIKHFQLLSSVGVSPTSRVFYLRSKGELENALRGLEFARLSLFHPSNILTPENRYGLGQAAVLAIWPHLNFVLIGPLRHLRGIKVGILGSAIAKNTTASVPGAGPMISVLEWDDFHQLAQT
ncbi:hypothetical protein NBRC116601_25150 [Cognatishimia sp. WU-CL00825]|uniref:NAD(P)H-binding protein n=1 Tax=Cognatishimia sp. WU-CL00825 TaxID=3127658 RepID=UPI00310567D5